MGNGTNRADLSIWQVVHYQLPVNAHCREAVKYPRLSALDVLEALRWLGCQYGIIISSHQYFHVIWFHKQTRP